MAPWLHGTLYVHLHEAKNVPIDRIIRMPDKVLCSQRRFWMLAHSGVLKSTDLHRR